MEIIYRKAVDSDLEGVNKILENVFGHGLDKIINTSDKYSLIGVYDNQVVAHLFVTKIYNDIKQKTWYKIDDVCVDESFRGQHIASTLLKELEKYANSDGVDYLELTSNKKRVAAHKLYKNDGFEIVDTCLFRKVIK